MKTKVVQKHQKQVKCFFYAQISDLVIQIYHNSLSWSMRGTMAYPTWRLWQPNEKKFSCFFQILVGFNDKRRNWNIDKCAVFVVVWQLWIFLWTSMRKVSCRSIIRMGRNESMYYTVWVYTKIPFLIYILLILF